MPNPHRVISLAALNPIPTKQLEHALEVSMLETNALFSGNAYKGFFKLDSALANLLLNIKVDVTISEGSYWGVSSIVRPLSSLPSIKTVFIGLIEVALPSQIKNWYWDLYV